MLLSNKVSGLKATDERIKKELTADIHQMLHKSITNYYMAIAIYYTNLIHATTHSLPYLISAHSEMLPNILNNIFCRISFQSMWIIHSACIQKFI